MPPRRNDVRGGLGRSFRLLVSATAVSGLGDGFVLAAFPLLAANLTHDPRLVVAVTIAQRLPWLLFSLPAGALVDRGDRRRLIVMVEVARAIVLGAFAVAVIMDRGALAALLITAFLIGIGETVVANAVHAVLPQVVRPADLGRANGTLFAVETATENLAGPALGGFLFAAAAALPFALDGASYAFAAVLVAVGLPAAATLPRRVTPSQLWPDMAEGVSFFVRTPLLRLLAAFVAALAFCQAMVFGPLVLFALDELGLSDAGYGLLLGVAAIGNVVGGTVAGRLDDRFGARVLLPISGLVAAGAYAACGNATDGVVAALALVAEAVAVAVGNVANLALRQRVIPNELLGRVGSVFRFFIFGAMPVGALAGGLVASAFGLRAPFAVAAGLQIVAVAVLARPLARHIRERDGRAERDT
jgi:MFS family permease